MFDLKAAYNTITVEEILSKVTEWSLWKHYCSNFETLDRSFRSELYNDNNPSCRIYQTNGRLRYKDFGTGDNLNIFEYIQKKYNCTFNECLNNDLTFAELPDVDMPINTSPSRPNAWTCRENKRS